MAAWFLSSISQVQAHANKNHSYQDGKTFNISLILLFICLFKFLETTGLKYFIGLYDKNSGDLGPRNS